MKSLISAVIILCSVAVVYALYANKPQTRKRAPKKPVVVVKTVKLEKRAEKIFVEAFGTVIPSKTLDLRSEVEGRVLRLNDEVVPGGIVKKGDLLLEIDAVDYTLQVAQLQAEVARAEYELELEEGQQVIARQEWQLLEKEIEVTKSGRALALREPHLRQAKKKVEAAKSKLAAAELQVERTKLYAPFHGLILEESIEAGQLLNRQNSILTLVDVDTFWVQVLVPVSRLGNIPLPGMVNFSPPAVTVTWEQNDGVHISRRGQIFKLLGELEGKGRMARLIVTIQDPLNLSQKHSGRILLESFVKVRIEAGELEDVYIVPREALRDGNLWLVNEKSELEQASFKVVWRREGELLISAELQPGSQLVVSRLVAPLPGMQVRVEGRVKDAAAMIEQKE